MKNTTLCLLLISACVLTTMVSCGDVSEPEEKTAATVSREETGTTAPEKTETEASPAKPELTTEMWTAFQRFRAAMLAKDRNVLVAMSVPDLENGCAYGEMSRDSTAWKLCDLPDEAQLVVLEKRISPAVDTDVTSGGCVYKDFLNVDEDGSGFYWTVGCIHLLGDEDEMGEYTTSFHFKKINGKFRLDKAQCAG